MARWLGMDQEHYVAYIREEANYEIARLRTLLRNSHTTEEDRGIELAMLEFYEDARTTEGTSSPQSLEHLDLPRRKSVLENNSKPKEREAFSSQKAQAA